MTDIVVRLLLRALVAGGACIALVSIPCPAQVPAVGIDPDATIQVPPIRYQVVAEQGYLHRRVTGKVTTDVEGIPAEPVDSMTYDGVGAVPIQGRLVLEVSPVTQDGLMVVHWTDRNGEWTVVQRRFHHPEHLSGVRIGPSVGTTENQVNLGVATNVYMHGDTTAGMPSLPTLFAYLGAWGPVHVKRNGKPFENPYELPAPDWIGHMMVTEGVRQPDGTVRAKDGSIYNPMKHATSGATEPYDMEVHFTFHDERFPRTDNVSSLFQFQYHLIFEEVSLRVIDASKPLLHELDIDPALLEPNPRRPGAELR